MLLISCIAASVAGAIVGALIVQRSPVRLVQGVVGIALLGLRPRSMPCAILGLTRRRRGAHVADCAVCHRRWRTFHGRADDVRNRPLRAFTIVMQLAGSKSNRSVSDHDGVVRVLMPISSLRFIVSSDRIDLRIVLGLAMAFLPCCSRRSLKSLDLVTFALARGGCPSTRRAVVAVLLFRRSPRLQPLLREG